jgi:glutathione S-transferase
VIFVDRSLSHDNAMTTLRVFTFTPNWGLPSTGPFAIKLLAWLELTGIPYEQVIEDNPRKGPKGKNPWIVLDGEPIGDTELIIELLSKRYGFDLDAGLSSEQKAIGLAWRRTFEEHFHQVLEWELFEHPAGATYMRKNMLLKMPPVVGPLVFSMLRSHLRRQLYARGLARHTPDIIEAKGRADIDALAAFLCDKPFLLGPQPTTADTAVFGLLAPMVYWPMQTPVASYAKSVRNIASYCDRMHKRCFRKNRVVPKPA